MADTWDNHEDLSADDDLVVTDHRDREEPLVEPDEETGVESAAGSPRAALGELGEDVSSSPARRGRGDGSGA